ncbi:MAG TPA: NCS2 family permease [Kofleriaceae bacterium]|nr:NCS2 family permease [Kofleriaceae bacterium]
MGEWLDRRFGYGAAGSSLRVEVLGGATTFMTMAYILFVNGAILGGAGLDPAQVLTATALVAGVMTIAMGAATNYPFALAPGMGINAAVAGTLVAAQGLSPAEAMGVIVAEGAAITILVAIGVREAILDAIPRSLQRAIGAGIGLFLAVIGLAEGGLVTRATSPGALPVVQLGDLRSPHTAVFLVGLVLALILSVRRVRGALLIAIAAATVLALVIGEAPPPRAIVTLPDFGLLGHFSFGFVAKLGALGAVLAVFTLMLSDFFDTVGTAVGLGAEGGFLDENGRLPRMRRVLLVDSLAAAVGGLASTSSATTYIESASGIADGARTGLASLVTGGLFLVAMFIAPLAGVVPAEATASALVVVGFLMAGMLAEIDWRDVPHAAAAFLTAVVMPFTWSISNGIGVGVITHVILMTVAGRIREINPLLWVVAAAFAAYFAAG